MHAVGVLFADTWDGPFFLTAPWEFYSWDPGQVAVHTHHLPNGKMLFWTSGGFNQQTLSYYTHTFLWTPGPRWTPGTRETGLNSRTNVYCSGHTFDINGNVVVAGGEKGLTSSQSGIGTPDANLFQVGVQAWLASGLPSMAEGRWYTTLLRLANGFIAAISGQKLPDLPNTIPELYDGSSWIALNGANRVLPNYPYMFLIPSATYTTGPGEVFYAGPEYQSAVLNVTNELWRNVASPSPAAGIYDGSAVMYLPGKILKCGGRVGSNPAVKTTALIDLNVAEVQWTWRLPAGTNSPEMREPRQHHNLVMLPTGNILAVNGNEQGLTGAAKKRPEIFDTTTENWGPLLATAGVARPYHSTAWLLRDARVATAGGERPENGGQYTSVEIYSPPYLDNNPVRPVIINYPSEAHYGDSYDVTGTNFTSSMTACLIGLASTTHGFDMNQRYVPLVTSGIQYALGLMQVEMPPNATYAPPGWYMLFILNSQGVPCTLAAYVHLSNP